MCLRLQRPLDAGPSRPRRNNCIETRAKGVNDDEEEEEEEEEQEQEKEEEELEEQEEHEHEEHEEQEQVHEEEHEEEQEERESGVVGGGVLNRSGDDSLWRRDQTRNLH